MSRLIREGLISEPSRPLPTKEFNRFANQPNDMVIPRHETQIFGIPGKPPGMSGLLAPRLWAQGKYQEVLDYVAQDVRIAMGIALKCEERRKFEWITRKGSKSSLNLPQGWLTVGKALLLPEPDTSWMSSPINRRAFTGWIEEH